MDKDEMVEYAMKAKYVVITSEGNCSLFSTMREITHTYMLDHSTISKALQKNVVCICKTKTMDNICIRSLPM